MFAQVVRLEGELSGLRTALADNEERAEAAETRERALIGKVAELVMKAQALERLPWWRKLFRRRPA